MSKLAQQRFPSRRSMRLRGYDYSSHGLYFVTICTQGKKPLLGAVVDGQMRLGVAGREVKRAWHELPLRFPGLALDAFVVMPNHVHGVLAIVGAGLRPRGAAESIRTVGAGLAPPGDAFTLGEVVGAFKSLSAIAVNRALHRQGVSLWQRNYYEHIIRTGKSLASVQRYILENPLTWAFDPENPEGKRRTSAL